MPTAHEYAQGLREMADFIDAYPHELNFSPQEQYLHPRNDKNRKEEIAEFARLAGHAVKEFSHSLFSVIKEFPGGVALRMLANREDVCERVLVGEEIIPAKGERFIPAEPERTVQKFEWRCTPLLSQEEEAALTTEAQNV